MKTTALVHLPSFSKAGQELIRSVFKNLIEVDEYEATEFMACNASAFGGTDVVLQHGAEKTGWRLRALGVKVHEVETGRVYQIRRKRLLHEDGAG